MKSRILTYVTAITLFAALAAPIPLIAQDQQRQRPPHTYYAVKDLGTLGGTTLASAEGISNRGWVTGASNVAGDKSGHAFLWRDGVMTDLGTLGGLNSWMNFPEKVDREFAAGYAETSQIDPLAENFCGFGTGLICVPFLWENGVMTQLPTLGGNNGYASNINHHRQIVGFAETSVLDATCQPPQQFNLKGVVWGPKPGEMQVLAPFPGDDASIGIGINDRGQAIGQSGPCVSDPVANGTMQRGVIWQNGISTDLGGLKGSVPYTFPWAINNKGQVIGQSNAETILYGPIVHAFLWQKGSMTDLGVLPDFNFISASFGFNDKGQVVGISLDPSFNAHGFIWQDGVMTDLNDLIKPGPLAIYDGNDINDKGEIVGTGIDQNTNLHAILLIPCDENHASDQSCEDAAQSAIGIPETGDRPKVVLPENAREQLRKRLGFGRFGLGR